MDINKIVTVLGFRTQMEYAAALGCSRSNITHQKRRIREGRPPGPIVRRQIEQLADKRGVDRSLLGFPTAPAAWTWDDVVQDTDE